MTTLVEQLLDKAVDSLRAQLYDLAPDITKAMEETIKADEDCKPVKFPVSIRLVLKPRGAVGDCAVKVSFGVKQRSEEDVAVVREAVAVEQTNAQATGDK